MQDVLKSIDQCHLLSFINLWFNCKLTGLGLFVKQ
jgi:hypothetical protein